MEKAPVKKQSKISRQKRLEKASKISTAKIAKFLPYRAS
jgi:hypothetical protein